MSDATDRAETMRSRSSEMRRMLELELEKVRAEATAASLAAKAADLELRLRRMMSTESGDDATPSDVVASSARIRNEITDDKTVQDRNVVERSPVIDHQNFVGDDIGGNAVFGGWSDVEAALGAGVSASSPPAPRVDGDDSKNVTAPAVHRFDAAQTSVKPPSLNRLRSSDVERRPQDASDKPSGPDLDSPEPLTVVPVDSPAMSPVGEMVDSPAMSPVDEMVDSPATSPAGDMVDMQLDADDEALTVRRRRSPAVIVSTLVHVALIVMLAMIGFQTHSPKDQIAITSSATEQSETAMETFTIEEVQPQEQPIEETQPTAAEFEAELSPIGTTPIGQPDFQTPTFAQPMASLASMTSAKALSKLTSDSNVKMEFCGVEGGGNHFVYLLDSSGSMGEAFDSARAELMQSIELLQPEQRFYVIFFDSEPDYMRIRNPAVDEAHSVRATDENKAAVRRWMMTIEQNYGKNPASSGVLQFALDLRPDVIFLLSDGEFPERVETLLKENNKIENLFDDPKPIAIVHTIGYHSREGETRMRRIAAQNNGQYRYVPK